MSTLSCRSMNLKIEVKYCYLYRVLLAYDDRCRIQRVALAELNNKISNVDSSI